MGQFCGWVTTMMLAQYDCTERHAITHRKMVPGVIFLSRLFYRNKKNIQ